MTQNCKLEIYVSERGIEETLTQILNKVLCYPCTVEIKDVNEPAVAEQAKQLKVSLFPAVVSNGKLMTQRLDRECCAQDTCCSAN